MGRVQSSLVLNDQMSRVLGRINKAMGSVLDSFEAVQRASGRSFNTANIAAARREIGAADAALNEMEQSYRDCNNQQQQLNRHIGQGTSAAGGLLGKIKSIASAYLGMKTVTGLVGLSDTITQTDARLSMMNDGLQTTAELNDMIYASAQRSRGSYLATADAVAKLGLMAGDAFSSNKETIAFMEQVNKQFKIAGTSAAGIDAAMLQLTQAMGSGVLRGEEYNSILEQAPNIIQAIAKYLDVPKGQLKEMAADGKITADIVKAAMFACADETNAKFESMPKTWSDIWTSMKNRAIKALDPVLAKINQLANSERVQRTVNGLLRAFSVMAVVLAQVFDGVCAVYNFVADNWSWLRPVIMGIVGALLLYKAAVFTITAIETIAAVAKGIFAAATALQAGATFAATAAQYGLNTAIWACPITWIVALILLFIAALILLWENCEGFRKFWADMWRKNMDILLWAYNNVIVPVANWFMSTQSKVAVAVSNFARWCVNAYYDMLTSITEAISSLMHKMSGLVTFYNKMASAMGATTISIDAVDNYTDQFEKSRQKYLNSIASYEDKYGTAKQIEKINEDAFNEKADEWQNKIANFTISGWLGEKWSEIKDGLSGWDDSFKETADAIKNNTGDTAKNTSKSNEELSYLRDIAEREAINRFTTAEIRVDMSGMSNRIDSNMDIDGIISYLTDGVAEALVTASEGVY